jgi:phage terminase Nu1 subunit (DNA packaging protein)
MPRARTIATNDLARIIDVTPSYIRKLTAQGIIRRARGADGEEIRGRYNLLAVRDYIRYLRSLLREDDEGEQRYSALRNQRLAKEAEMSQLRLRQMKGELHHASDVEFCMTNMCTYFKQGVLAIPSHVARVCVGKKFRQIYELLTTEIELVLRTLSGYDPAMFAAQRAEYLASKGVDLSSVNGETEAETAGQSS